ncbi:hydantoinase/oxoprolinase family protein [Alphaproteobacteria bacterium GH1-50]|uniref:Hydantoinase/oxoprolinase family protein n=1 Tax=Kangsaoukella pontilimi TaxID=2691042 RepID=A0A7C9MV19_9RHOB|nr:hydantoinase/oxoprolinase family protein [Kangsaoukella pontilimi]MXQ07340.1 hydantoinase/oxoprolinase family protein [Kangsaoukella pontilimi]
MTKYSLAIDIGGTFTDAVLLASDGRSFVDKTLTTHNNLIEGFFRGVDLVLSQADIQPSDVNDVVVHATTVVTNALIERKGPPVALLVTEGFRDVLYIREEHRYEMYDPQIEFAEPLIPSERTFAVAERCYADGAIGKEVDRAQIVDIIQKCRDQGIVSVAVCFLNAYRNGANEERVREIFAEEAPEIYVSLSSVISPQMREYFRASTTAINAYTIPITRPYLLSLIDELEARGFDQQPLIMLSNGGVLGAKRAGDMPVRMIESGPAAGALVACYFSRLFDIPDLISFDMGGTTAKACLVQNHEPLVAGTFEVDRRYRFKPGSGMPITVPSIDMIEIGAGGGSIASVDALGLLKIGPESSGSMPGPVCYGRGGENPCVTDADLVLGILDADRFLGGDMELDLEGAQAAFDDLGKTLGLSREAAAWGVFEVVCEQMAAATRTHATDRGIDYRGLPLLAFGGAGPVHACMVAELTESEQVIYPPLASVLSAFGTLVTPTQVDLVRSLVSQLDSVDWSRVDETLGAMVEEGGAALVDAGIPEDECQYRFGVELRYTGQQSEVRIELDGDPRETRDTAAIERLFQAEYEKQYGLKLDGMLIEVVNWLVTAYGRHPDRASAAQVAKGALPDTGSRTVHVGGTARDVPVFQRLALKHGDRIDGPAIIEERETTIFILEGWSLKLHPSGSLVADRVAARKPQVFERVA